MPAETPAPLWTPDDDQVEASAMVAFAGAVARDWEVEAAEYRDLWTWSVTHPARFWLSLRDFCAEHCGLRARTWGDRVLVGADDQPGGVPGVRWFPEARLNFAENLLHTAEGTFENDPRPALVFSAEGAHRRELSRGELWTEVQRLAAAFRQLGLEPGDRVAALMPNVPETVVAMLAASAIGATFTSCSPDFGVQGVLDRFGQVEPKVLVTVGGYRWKGRTVDIREKVEAIIAALPTLECVLDVPYPEAPRLAAAPLRRPWEELPESTEPLRFAALPFDHPLYIMYSSGTTGRPKCIVHGAGGTLLKHLSELVLHCGVTEHDRAFYYTTCGWMMWNWLVSGLAAGAALVLYDGNPLAPSPMVLFELADAEGITLFGTSAKYIDALAKAGCVPRESHSLASVRLMTSTGSPLAPESFDYVYQSIKKDLQLASIAGGTDIIGCFVLGDPTGPVWRGEIQCAALGMAVQVWRDDGTPLPPGQAGELVCTAPFPSMPVFFWGDTDGSRYRGAYFERFPGVWCHGDWIEQSERGGFIIHGRSDATLNPGGVRIGTAEIYRQVDLVDAVLESVVIGQRWDNDVRVVLFVRLREGHILDDDLRQAIRQQVRTGATPRHVPAKILQVTDIPRTRSGKVTELAVRRVVHGQAITNREALANPEALDQFDGRVELQTP
jgi:acetoacetyl-CoA synthetase